MNQETLEVIRMQIDQAAFAEAWEQGKRLTGDRAVTLAFAELD